MERITIHGSPGAGKSTLANKIAARTQLPIIHLDRVYWEENWVERDRKQALSIVDKETAKDHWIIEGINPSSYPARMERADTIIFIDLPRWQLLWRVTKRVIRRRGTVQPEMPQGCPEKFDWRFMIEIWNSQKKGQIRDKILLAIDSAPATATKFHLKSDRDIEAFLNGTRNDVFNRI